MHGIQGRVVMIAFFVLLLFGMRSLVGYLDALMHYWCFFLERPSMRAFGVALGFSIRHTCIFRSGSYS